MNERASESNRLKKRPDGQCQVKLRRDSSTSECSSLSVAQANLIQSHHRLNRDIAHAVTTTAD